MPILAIQVLFVLLWSSGFIGSKFAVGYAGTFTLLFVRYAIVSIVLIGFVLIRRGARVRSWYEVQQVAIVGVLAHGVYLSTMLVALALGAPAGIAAMILALQPILTGALAGLVLGERLQAHQWLGLAIGFIAVVLVVGSSEPFDAGLMAYALLFTSAGSVTVATLYQRWLDEHTLVGRMALSTNLAIQCSASAVALALPACFLEGIAIVWSAEILFSIAWLSLAVSLCSFGLLFFLLRRCPATQVASLTYFTVPATMILSYIVFGDTLSYLDIIGLLVAALGVVMVHAERGVAVLAFLRGLFQRVLSDRRDPANDIPRFSSIRRTSPLAMRERLEHGSTNNANLASGDARHERDSERGRERRDSVEPGLAT